MANVFYSVCPFGTGDIKTGSPTITISSGVATLSVSQTGNIGQGCRITYNTTSIAYISKVNSSTSFNVITSIGGTPSDVTGQTVNSIAHEFASLSSAESSSSNSSHTNNTDLTAADIRLHLVCYYDHDDDTADTTAVVIDGWTTDATRYIHIYTPTGGTQSLLNNRHSGKWVTGKYRLSPNSGGHWYTINISENYTIIEGLQISANSTGVNVSVICQAANIKILKNVIKNLGDLSSERGVQVSNSGGYVAVVNNIIYGFNNDTDSHGIAVISDNVYIYNNTCIGNTIGIYSDWYDASRRFINNLVSGNTTGFSFYVESSTRSYNASSDNTASGTGSRINQTFTFVDTEDYHLASNDAGAKDYGTDLSADANYPFSDDIDSVARTGIWDIGADEYTAAAASLPRRALDGPFYGSLRGSVR